MTSSRLTTRTVPALATATTVVLLGTPPAAAHVHGINPLRCTPAAPNAGALFGGGRDAAVCDAE